MALILPKKQKKTQPTDVKKTSSLVLPGEKRVSEVRLEQKYKKEATNQTAVDKDLYVQMRKRGNNAIDIQRGLEPEKVSKAKEGAKAVGKVLGGFFGQMSRNVKAGFDVTGGVLAAGIQAKTGALGQGVSPRDYAKIGVEEAKKTITTPGAPGIGTALFQGIRFGTRAAAAPVAAGFASVPGGVTPKQAFFEGIDRAKQVATEKDSYEEDWQKMSDMYLEKRKLGPYGTNEPTTADVAALAGLQFLNLTGDLGVGAIRGVGKAGALTKERLLFKKIGQVEKPLAEGTSFVKGTMKPLEIKVSEDLKFKIRPKTNEIVIEGYKRRFGGAKVLPEGAIPDEAKVLIPAIEKRTGSQIVARMEGDSLVLSPKKALTTPEAPKMLEAPKPQTKVPGAPVAGDGFVMTEKADKTLVTKQKKAIEYRAELQKYIKNPTPPQLKKVLALKKETTALPEAKGVPSVKAPTAPKPAMFEGMAKGTSSPKKEKVTVFRGDLGEVKQVEKEFENVLEVNMNQRQLLNEWADAGDTQAAQLLKESKSQLPNTFDNYIDPILKERGYDAVKYKNLDRKQVGTEYRDVSTGESFATQKSTAEAYSLGRTAKRTEQVTEPGKKESRVFKKTREAMEKEGDTTLSGQKVEYDVTVNKADEEAASKLVNEKFDEALDIVRGAKEKPDEQTFNNIADALAKKALEKGDKELFADVLRTQSLELTRAGKEIQSQVGKITLDDPAVAVRQVIKNKVSALGGQAKFDTMVKNQSKSALKKIHARAAKIKSAQSIIDSLTC